MRLTGTIFLTLLYLFAYTEFHEIFTLPSLVEHYRQHRQGDESLGFGDFLFLHYAGVKHQAEHEHDDIPFGDSHCINAMMSCSLNVPEGFPVDFNSTYQTVETEVIYYPERTSSFLARSIWQPPRFNS